MPHASPALAQLVRSRTDLLQHGWTDRRITAAVREGALFAFRRGWFIASADREKLWPEQRHHAHVIAVARDARGPAVMSHASAAVLWGLPLYAMRLARVHMTTATPRRISSAPDVFRHVAPLPSSDVTVRGGIRCTSLSRTVFDLIRTLPVPAAVAATDAAERQMADRQWEWDLDAVVAWRRGLGERLSEAGGARGIRQARWVAEFADGRAQLPGESVSRLQLRRLGFADPELQVPVDGPDGRQYFVDFGLADVRSFGEFDGKTKYVDEALRSERTLEQVLLAEKQREDWIRGRTQWGFARWGSEHIATPATLATRLASFHITPP
ncbi:hypothetical protein [Microbacterium sp. MYb62]|uniref:hypothetical protein n=1 Tax=Microbacterium sp. MYb62 TaxID=1848690 RepID=UPI000CFD99C1|nr:hypothetical protein [Microbacterium sp. MYb62]PRB11768.1 hypothetical protein CQ042_16060 [Microbacterium sp. MYb62]